MLTFQSEYLCVCRTIQTAMRPHTRKTCCVPPAFILLKEREKGERESGEQRGELSKLVSTQHSQSLNFLLVFSEIAVHLTSRTHVNFVWYYNFFHDLKHVSVTNVQRLKKNPCTYNIMYFVRCLKYSCFLLQPTRTEILWMLHVTSLSTHWKREYTALSDRPDSELLFTLPNWSIKIFSSVESLPVKCFFSDSQVPQVLCGMSVTVVIITIIITHTHKKQKCLHL